MDFSSLDLASTSPILALATLAIIVLFLKALLRRGEDAIFGVTLIGIVICIALTVATYNRAGHAFQGMIQVGGFTNFFFLVFLISTGLTVLISRSYLEREETNFGEYYCMLLFAALGMMLIAAAQDLIIIFLGIELMSISLYVLAGFMRKRPKSNESALKYFLLGAFATGFLLYGIALLYGVSGSTQFVTIAEKFPSLTADPIFWIGVGLLMVGLSFKVAAVPFHMWVPDVYEGAPTAVSAFMSTGGKAAAFSGFVLVFFHAFRVGNPKITDVLAILSAATMIIGNVVAVSQQNLKRMLAYSSIAHAGYMLTGLAAGNSLGQTGIMYYLGTYTFMNIGSFGVLSVLEQQEERNLTFEDYAGLGYKRPILAALMSIFMFSLSGIPPFAGFFGKYYVFAAAIKADLTWLAIIGVLTSAISVYYYLRLVVYMYFRESELAVTTAVSKVSLAALVVCAIAVTGLGILPSLVLNLTQGLF
jgi:NADH-quinone oxidoreductase subunit N